MFAQPAPPEPMVGPPARDYLPESGPVAKHAQMGQLVDNDGLQRLRGCEHQPPRKGQTPRPRATPPTSTRVADGDRGGGHCKRSRVSVDLAVDRSAGANPQPCLQDGRQLPPLTGAQAHDKLVAFVATLATDCGSATDRLSGHDPETVRLSAEPEHAAVAGGPQRRELRVLAGLPVEVPPQPRLAFGRKRLRQTLSLSPAASGPRRNRHDGHVPGIDGQADETGTGRSTDGAFEPPRRQPQRRSPFGRRRHGRSVAPDRASILLWPQTPARRGPSQRRLRHRLDAATKTRGRRRRGRGPGGGRQRGDEGNDQGLGDEPLVRITGQLADDRFAQQGLVAVTFAVAWGYSSAGRAPAWHAGGPGFESL